MPIDNRQLYLAPYVWKPLNTPDGPRAEAAMPGAYLKAAFGGSATVELVIDGTANRDCPRESMPVIEYSLDEGPFQIVPLTRTGDVYALPLGGQFDSSAGTDWKWSFAPRI